MKKSKRKIFFSLVLTCVLCAITACGKSVKEDLKNLIDNGVAYATN